MLPSVEEVDVASTARYNSHPFHFECAYTIFEIGGNIHLPSRMVGRGGEMKSSEIFTPACAVRALHVIHPAHNKEINSAHQPAPLFRSNPII